MPTHKSRGTATENKLVKKLISEGWVANRTPASLGTMDVIALKRGETPRYIQVKGTQKPFSTFGPIERYDLLADAQKAGARAELCWWPPYGQPRFFQPDEWPETFQPKDLTENDESV